MPKKRLSNKNATIIGADRVRYRADPEPAENDRRRAILEALANLGEVIYAIRCPDGLIKIGWTTRLRHRRYFYGGGFDAILAVIPGTHDEEQALHERFRPYRAKGHEYYHPTPEVLSFINEIRERAGIPPVPVP